MIRIINYFFQSFFIYIFFFIGRILGISLSRKIFSSLFKKIGPIFKSKRVINKNLNIFSLKVPEINRKKIISDMWANYGKTFIEYIFLNQLRKNKSQITILGEENLRKIIG